MCLNNTYLLQSVGNCFLRYQKICTYIIRKKYTKHTHCDLQLTENRKRVYSEINLIYAQCTFESLTRFIWHRNTLQNISAASIILFTWRQTLNRIEIMYTRRCLGVLFSAMDKNISPRLLWPCNFAKIRTSDLKFYNRGPNASVY